MNEKIPSPDEELMIILVPTMLKLMLSHDLKLYSNLWNFLTKGDHILKFSLIANLDIFEMIFGAHPNDFSRISYYFCKLKYSIWLVSYMTVCNREYGIIGNSLALKCRFYETRLKYLRFTFWIITLNLQMRELYLFWVGVVNLKIRQVEI